MVREEVILSQSYRGILRLLVPVRLEQASIFVVDEVECHQYSHAHTLKHPYYDQSVLVGKSRPDLDSAVLENVQGEPAGIGEGEEDGYDSVSATLFSKGAVDLSSLPCSPFSVDSFLCLQKQPYRQQNHHNDLE